VASQDLASCFLLRFHFFSDGCSTAMPIWCFAERSRRQYAFVLSILACCSFPVRAVALDPTMAAAIRTVEKNGATIVLAANGDPIELHLHEQGVNNLLFTHIAKLRSLELVDLENTPFTNAILPQLGSLPNLREVVLVGTRIDRRSADTLKLKHPNVKIVWEHTVEGRRAALIEVQRRGLQIQESTSIVTGRTTVSLRASLPAERWKPSIILMDDDWIRGAELIPETTELITELHESSPVRFSDRSIIAFSVLPLVETAAIGNTILSAKGLEPLMGHPSLSMFRFYGVDNSSPVVLRPLRKVPQLFELELRAPTDTQLIELSGISGLRSLTIYGNTYSDVGLTILKSMLNLERLVITTNSDRTLSVISKLPNVKEVYCSVGPNVTDEGIAQLASAGRIERLRVDTSAPSDHSPGVENIRFRVTRKGFISLKEKLETGGRRLKSANYNGEDFANEN
jgi:hypothetical protein